MPLVTAKEIIIIHLKHKFNAFLLNEGLCITMIPIKNNYNHQLFVENQSTVNYDSHLNLTTISIFFSYTVIQKSQVNK